MAKRKIIQFAVPAGQPIVLLDDGTLWQRGLDRRGKHYQWYEIEGPPDPPEDSNGL